MYLEVCASDSQTLHGVLSAMYITSRFSGLKPPLRGGSPLHELTVRAWICQGVLLQLGSTTSRIWWFQGNQLRWLALVPSLCLYT